MEPTLLGRLAKDFGDQGARAAQLLQTAEALMASPSSAPRIGEAIAYCIREALVEVPRAAGVEEGRWRHISRSVVTAQTRYVRARGLTGMDEKQALEDLLKSIDDLAALHHQDSIHVERLRQIIRLRTGVDPLTHNRHVLAEYQQLLDDIQGMVHPTTAGNPITVEAASACHKPALDILSRLFLVDPRIVRLTKLAALEQPTDADVDILRANLITPHDLRFFASSVSSPTWLDLLLDKGLLEPPQDPNETWPAAMMLDRLREDHGAALATWLEKAWARWSSTERGLIALALLLLVRRVTMAGQSCCAVSKPALRFLSSASSPAGN